MAEWKNYTLEEVCERIYSGGTPSTKHEEYWNGDIKWLSSGETSQRFVYDTERKITQEGVENSSTKLATKGCTVVATAGQGYTRGQASFLMTDTYMNQSVIACKANENVILPLYLYYNLDSRYEEFRLLSDGTSTRGGLSGWILKRMEIKLPPKPSQKKIIDILYSIDRKIEENKAINNNLEQQAQTLFKSWFVDFEPFDESFIDSPIGTKIPHSLQMVQIGSLPHILETGKRPKGGAVATGVPSIGAENVKRLGEVNFASAKYIPVEFAQKMDKGKIHGYELMLYKDGGKPGTFIPHFSMFGEGFPYDDFFINEHVFKLDFGDKGFNEFCYFYLQTNYPYNWLANNGGKAAVPGINQQDVNSIWIYPPDNPLVKEYCKWVQPIFTTILRNCSQNVKLSQLRDALLPKLMSGELDVSDIDL